MPKKAMRVLLAARTIRMFQSCLVTLQVGCNDDEQEKVGEEGVGGVSELP